MSLAQGATRHRDATESQHNRRHEGEREDRQAAAGPRQTTGTGVREAAWRTTLRGRRHSIVVGEGGPWAEAQHR